ncbi:MAG: hypothetical protein HQL16_00120 [Candidatus Omnitrophica bacterium]|nr:hypothetical protein [Candidatus Omnitrophota bacterium]
MKDTLFLILKFVFALIILPVVVALTFAFQNELATFEPALRHTLWQGMVTYVLLRFFVYDFSAVYAFGQGIVTSVFQFLKPLVNAAPYVLPIYTILVLLVYAVISVMGKLSGYESVFIFLFAFTFTMHIVLTAQDLYKKDSIAGKPNYFFSMILVYIFDVFFMALLMSLILKGFSFTHFFQGLTGTSADIYRMIFKQLF